MKNNITQIQGGNSVRKLPRHSKMYQMLFLGALMLLSFVGACKKDDFEDEIVGLCPIVVSTDPTDKDVDVLLDKVISITFNTDMDSTTINNQTFTIKQGETSIVGKISPTADLKVFTFKPNVPLSPFVLYSGTVTKGAKDVFHTAMELDYLWSFTTIPAVSLTANPAIGGVLLGAGTFPLNSSVAITAAANANYIFTSWTENGITVSNSRNYQFAITKNRNLIANFTVIPPGSFGVNLSSNPAAGGTNTGAGVYAPATFVTVIATANAGYNFVNWTENGAAVSTNSNYQFAIIANRTLVANYSAVPGVGPGAIDLGTAGDFGILTKSGISTTGITSVTGNIGVSPAAATAITGFGLIMYSNGQSSHTPIVTGKVYASDYAAPTPANMTKAVSDMETAFTTANGLVTPAPIVGLYAGDISGRILTAGLYKWSTGVLISNAGVTLTGGPNDTWVFQIAQDLTVNNGAKITLSGGAQAKNIFWVVTGQATVGSSTDFSGIILSKTLISLNTGAKVTGKLLAQTAVTLNASTVIQP